MLRMAFKITKWFLALLSIVTVTFLAVQIYNSQRGLPLDVWHTYVPHELSPKEIDAADWRTISRPRRRIFDSLRVNVSEKLTPEEQVPFNRYFRGQPRLSATFFAGLEPVLSSRARRTSGRRCRAPAWFDGFSL